MGNGGKIRVQPLQPLKLSKEEKAFVETNSGSM